VLVLPNLDDRTYEEIKEEAIRNIIKYCPEWTNHNASDPGITLVELFSAMTEMTNYRLNRVPEKNYIAFLDMIGITPRYPVSAKSRVLFNISENYELSNSEKTAIKVPKHTIISTSDNEPLIFETLKEHNIYNLKINDIFSITYNKDEEKNNITSHIENLNSHTSFLPFEQKDKETSQIAIYIKSEKLLSLNESSKTTLLFRLPTNIKDFDYHNEKDFLKRQQWQYYNGSWNDLSIDNIDIKVDQRDAYVLQVTFDGKNSIEKKEFEEFGEDYYIRCIFKEAHRWYKEFSLYEISLASNSIDSGIVPDCCYYRSMELDLNSDILPFGQEPNLNENIEDEVFYIKCDEAFSKQNSTISVSIRHSQNNKYEMPIGYDDLKISWSYSNGNKEFVDLEINSDNIQNFTKNGTVEFQTPKNFGKNVVNGLEGYWIKAKIVSGHFGRKEEVTYNESGEIDRVKSTQTLKPPKLSGVKIKYKQDRVDLENCISYNNYSYNKIEFESHHPIKLFKENYIKENALFLYFDSFISDNNLSIYFDIGNTNSGINLNKLERVISWEILQNGEWKKLIFEDNSDNLTKSGEINFIIPKIEKLETYQIDNTKRDGMWIKGSVNFNAINNMLPIKDILLNTIEVAQQETIENEYLGKSNGLPYIKFNLNYTNLVDAPRILVGEDEYNITKRFIDNSSESLVYRFNPITAQLEFGDNEYGKVPTVNEKIYAQEYSITQGSKGNIAKGKINNLRTSINFIDSVSNITTASGGKDGDDIDSIKKYAPSIFKSRDRAVTSEDYEAIAKEYTPSIIDVRCINQINHLEIVLVTKELLSKDGFINRKLIYDLEAKLQEKSLVTVVVKVKEAKKYNLNAYVKIRNSGDKVLFQKDIDTKLNQVAKEYFSPAKGFGIGKNITKADFYKILNKVDSSLYFDDIKISKNSKSVGDRLIVQKDEIAIFDSIVIEEFSNEQY
jgi:hypothetical protein